MTMVPVNSAQREPSMEEILASIRRIIEDSDSTRKVPEPTEAGEVDAFRAELRSAEPVRSEGRADAFSLEPQLVAPEPLGTEESPESFAPAEPDASGPLSMDVGEADDATHQQDERTTPAADLELDMSDLSAGQANGAHFSFPSEAAAPHAEMIAPQETQRAQDESARPAIISEQIGRQVAASFGELSEAFAARSRRSFDEIAQEMLRPMLQEWLDNNLPHLVERLVREEIERIARGAAATR